MKELGQPGLGSQASCWGVPTGGAAGSILPRCPWDSSPHCLQPWANASFALQSALSLTAARQLLRISVCWPAV